VWASEGATDAGEPYVPRSRGEMSLLHSIVCSALHETGVVLPCSSLRSVGGDLGVVPLAGEWALRQAGIPDCAGTAEPAASRTAGL
jgi:hypothetical protein